MNIGQNFELSTWLHRSSSENWGFRVVIMWLLVTIWVTRVMWWQQLSVDRGEGVTTSITVQWRASFSNVDWLTNLPMSFIFIFLCCLCHVFFYYLYLTMCIPSSSCRKCFSNGGSPLVWVVRGLSWRISSANSGQVATASTDSSVSNCNEKIKQKCVFTSLCICPPPLVSHYIFM